jgi:hypothetical protein
MSLSNILAPNPGYDYDLFCNSITTRGGIPDGGRHSQAIYSLTGPETFANATIAPVVYAAHSGSVPFSFLAGTFTFTGVNALVNLTPQCIWTADNVGERDLLITVNGSLNYAWTINPAHDQPISTSLSYIFNNGDTFTINVQQTSGAPLDMLGTDASASTFTNLVITATEFTV